MLLFRALASGSSGNAYLLRVRGTTLLFEAGLRLPRLCQYLAAEEVDPRSIDAVLISHEHRDHCLAARDLATSFGTRICAELDVLRAAGLEDLPSSQVLDLDAPNLFGDVTVSCFPVDHDAVSTIGYLINADNRAIALATDLGSANDSVAAAVRSADLVVLEANHDREMLLNGRYPHHLRRRVGGPAGHLSNSQSGGILARNVCGEAPEVWLAHLSKENNTPALALRTVRRFLKAAGRDDVPVDVAGRDRPSLRWTGRPRPRQLELFSGVSA